jgi:hypothetical protein
MKIKPGSGFYFESSMFHSLPSLHLKRHQPDSFYDGFLKVSVFKHSFKISCFILKNERVLLAQQSLGSHRLSLSY